VLRGVAAIGNNSVTGKPERDHTAYSRQTHTCRRGAGGRMTSSGCSRCRPLSHACTERIGHPGSCLRTSRATRWEMSASRSSRSSYCSWIWSRGANTSMSGSIDRIFSRSYDSASWIASSISCSPVPDHEQVLHVGLVAQFTGLIATHKLLRTEIQVSTGLLVEYLPRLLTREGGHMSICFSRRLCHRRFPRTSLDSIVACQEAVNPASSGLRPPQRAALSTSLLTRGACGRVSGAE
jgi:hypothetical protein